MSNKTIESLDIVELTSKHCKLTINGLDADVGSIIVLGDLVKIIPDYGWAITISTTPFIYFYDRYLDDFKVYFTVSVNRDYAELVFPPDLFNNGSWGEFSVSTEQVAIEVSGTNNVYLIDVDALSEINKQRIQVTPLTGEITDYGTYILGVLQLPFEIDASYVLSESNVVLGGFETTVPAPAISTDYLPVDMGSISVLGDFNNSLDYVETVAILRLPYIESIQIDLEYVINETISIEYAIDLYSGRATINIASSKTGGVIRTITANMGISIPYDRTYKETTLLNNSNISVGGDNHITTPYIEIVKKAAILPGGIFTIPIVDEGLITDSGFYTIENIDLICSANNDERQEIINLLSNGVFVK